MVKRIKNTNENMTTLVEDIMIATLESQLKIEEAALKESKSCNAVEGNRTATVLTNILMAKVKEINRQLIDMKCKRCNIG